MNEDILYIEQFLNGDQRGFEALVRKYQDKLLNIVYSIIGSDMEAEDVLQEVFLKVYHSLRSFERKSQFSTWLYRITVNMVYDFLRRRSGSLKDEEAIDKSVSPDKSPREKLAAKEKDAIIRKAIAKVPAQFRVAMVLKDIEGLSYSEIAKVLDCSIGTVESKIYRARQFLKEEIIRIGGVEI